MAFARNDGDVSHMEMARRLLEAEFDGRQKEWEAHKAKMVESTDIMRLAIAFADAASPKVALELERRAKQAGWKI